MCDEIETPLFPQEQLYVLLHPSGARCLVCRESIDKIPPTLREAKPIPGTAAVGLNVYQGIAGLPSPSVLSPGIVPGAFLFSISDKTATQYIPRAYLKAFLRVMRSLHNLPALH
jgi:hypothetical protein